MIFEKKYPFGEINISEEDTKDGPVRVLSVNGARESACYVEESRHYDLRFGYTLEFAQILEMTDADRQVLLIGGAGFSVPKYFISHFRTGTIDVVELHEEMYEIAREYFFLKELCDEYSHEIDSRMHVFFDDGNHFIENCSGKYNIVLDDAYSGRVKDAGLISERTVGNIAGILSADGKYAINLITPVKGYGSMQASLACSILKNHFKHVKMWQVDPNRAPTERQNCIILASKPK
ncbi:MAG: fused MFS/spermidine synthase [Lachnospiraceae bacterium]|nr:fused MFS/spermidine synthase [Lachnospiraceae bacterium]MBQ9606577.1 fused MFS/spermidine synthase [Lachnospiraceae bacterium]